MKLKTLVISALFLLAMLAFSACGGGDDTAPPIGQPDAGQQAQTPAQGNDPAVTTPAGGGGGTVTHVHMSESPFMDPIRQNDSATADITMQMYEGLVMFTPYPQNEIIPMLATSWSQPDDVTWEFNLRQGVYFHDGSYFTADSWAWSIQRLLDPREAAPGAFILDMIEDVYAVDTYTVRVVTEFPFTPLLAHLTHQVAYAVSPAALANEVHYRMAEEGAGYVLSPWQEGALAYAEGRGLTPAPTMVTHRPIGTGVFRYQQRIHGDRTIMVPNENHWSGNPPQIDELIFLVIPDPITRFAMVQTGDANSQELAPGDVMQLSMHPQINHLIIAGTGIDYIGFNMSQDGPLADVRVRQALTYGLNAESVIMGAYEGIGIPAVGPIGPNVLYSPHDVIPRRPFDPDRARELLAEAGYPDGFDIRFWTNHGNAPRLATAEIAQFYWSQIGVNVEIETIEWGVYLDSTAAGEHDLFMLGWTTITGDPDYGTISLFHSDFFGAPGNRTFYYNPVVDALLTEGRMSTDSARRAQIYHDITLHLVEDAPWIFLRHPIMNWGTNGINGFAVDFNNRPHFRNVTVAE